MRPRVTAILCAGIPYAAVAVGLYAVQSAWAAILLYHAGVVVVLTSRGWRRPMSIASRGWHFGAAAAAVPVAALAGAALYVLWPIIDATPHGLGARLSEFGLGGFSWVGFAVYYSTIHPVLEEFFWRGSPRSGGVRPDWRDAAFAGYHVPVLVFFVGPVWVALSFIVLAAASWLWRVAARRFDGLGVPLVSHAVADASIVVAATLICRGG